MSVTIEFYAAEPDKILSVFELEDFDQWYEAKNLLPSADFSLHLSYPEDLDNLVEACRRSGLELPEATSFTDLLVETIWDDGEGSAKLQKVDSSLSALGLADDEAISLIASRWGQSLEDSNASLQAIRSLREVCKHANLHGESVVLYTCY